MKNKKTKKVKYITNMDEYIEARIKYRRLGYKIGLLIVFPVLILIMIIIINLP